jgi:hypothetical protein
MSYAGAGKRGGKKGGKGTGAKSPKNPIVPKPKAGFVPDF